MPALVAVNEKPCKKYRKKASNGSGNGSGNCNLCSCRTRTHTRTLSRTQTPLERAAIQHSTQKLFWCYFNLKVNRSVICGIKYNSSREREQERDSRERGREGERVGVLGAKIEINKNENQIKEAELRKMPFAQFSHTVHNSLDSPSPSPQPPSPSPSLQLQFAISVCVWLAGICGRFSIWP